MLEGPPKKTGGICCVRAPNDKTVSGEYVLARPPKKPGGICCVLAPNHRKGIWRTEMFVMIVLLLFDGVECTRGGEEVKTSFNMLLVGIILAGDVVSALSKGFQSYVEEHFWDFVAVNIAVKLFSENLQVFFENCEHIRTR